MNFRALQSFLNKQIWQIDTYISQETDLLEQYSMSALEELSRSDNLM